MSAGLNYGFWHGYCNVTGLQLALLLQIVIAAAGLGALLAARMLRRLRSPRRRLFNRTFGAPFIGAAGLLASVHRAA